MLAPVTSSRGLHMAIITTSIVAFIGTGLVVRTIHRAATAKLTSQSISLNPQAPSPSSSAQSLTTDTAATAPALAATPDAVPPGAGAYAEVASYLSSRGTHTGLAAIDLTTGASVSFNPTVGFHTASIVKVDILATLLLQHQQRHTKISESENDLAVKMITQSDNDAANSLWHIVGGGDEVRAANKTFNLTGTRPGPGGNWGATITTAKDQLRLLQVLVTSDSPLTASSRGYELGLMRRVESDQRWGVPAAASDDATSVAVKNGWYPFSDDEGAWTINSLGEIVQHGHVYLVAVLSNDNTSQEKGQTIVGSAAKVAIWGLSGGAP